MNGMNDMNEVTMPDGKQKIGKAAAIFVVVMLLLTFFSNTINNYSLPRVEYEMASRGAVVKNISIEGKVHAREVFEYYAGSSVKALEVTAEAGERVIKGQRLALLDTGAVKRRLQDEKDRLEQMKLSLEKLRNVASTDNTAAYDRTVEAAKGKMEKAKKDYELTKLLYEAGGETAMNVRKALDDMEDARREYEEAVSDRDRAVKDSRIRLENNEIEIKSLLLDLSIQERVIKDLEEQAEMCDIHAPFDGVVLEINITKGCMTDSSKPLYRMADTSKGYRLTGMVEAKAASYIAPGDTVRVSVDALDGESLSGRVVEIRDSPGREGVMKDISIELADERLADGQYGHADIRKSTRTYDVLVSNNAVGQDNTGYFVYVLKERKGLLGDEYYVQTVRVTIGEADDEKTAVVSGLSSFEKVVAATDKPLSDGARVLVGE